MSRELIEFDRYLGGKMHRLEMGSESTGVAPGKQ